MVPRIALAPALALAAALSLNAAAASAASVSLVYDGATVTDAKRKTVTIETAPVDYPGAGDWPKTVYAFGFRMTDTSGPLGSFVAWCLDLASFLSTSTTVAQPYKITTDPFSNSYELDTAAQARVQKMFDANYTTLTLTNGNQVAGFQLALWDAVYDGDGKLNDGAFRATASDTIKTLANGYMSAAAGWTGGKRFDMTFLESTGTGSHKRQNLVTVAPVPVPAAGGLLLLAVGGLAALRRRRKTA